MTRPSPFRLLATTVLAALPALVVASCGGHDAAPAWEETAPPLRAVTAVAQRLTIERRVELNGRVEADRNAAVSARVLATVSVVHVAAGDAVRRGQLLLEIEGATAEGQVAQSRGAVAQATAALSMAERNHRRYEALAEKEAASQLEVDLARMQFEQARGAVEQAEGALAAARSVASDTRVTAPFDGKVVQRLVEVGDLAAPGRPLLLLESSASRRLAVAVPESVARGIAVGDSVPVALDARPDLGRLLGTVVEMAPGSDPMSHSFAVKIELPAGDLASGAAGRAWLPAGERAAVVVPAAAVLRQGGLEIVVLADGDGRTASRVVRTGEERPDGSVEILSGLSGGETLLVGLSEVPKAGRPVQEVAG